MGSVMNGLALHGGVRPYGGTFMVFSDYMRGAVRMAAIMDLPVTFVFTHDSIGLGEDGPTHQPIEHVASLRLIPNLWVIRPADANETAVAWRMALARTHGPTALALTRQPLPVLDPARYPTGDAARGGYVLVGDADPQVLLLSSGSEVHVALAARAMLAHEGIRTRVVSMPCTEAFDAQPAKYREAVLPPGVRARVGVEAGVTAGLSKYVGLDGEMVGLDRFGASAPYQTLYTELGITPEEVARAAGRVVAGRH
jgi:transketolase